MAKMEPMEIKVIVELSEEDRELLRKVAQSGVTLQGDVVAEVADRYFGVGGYGSQDR